MVGRGQLVMQADSYHSVQGIVGAMGGVGTRTLAGWNVWETVKVREAGSEVGRLGSWQHLTGPACPSAGEGAAAGRH